MIMSEIEVDGESNSSNSSDTKEKMVEIIPLGPSRLKLRSALSALKIIGTGFNIIFLDLEKQHEANPLGTENISAHQCEQLDFEMLPVPGTPSMQTALIETYGQVSFL